MSHHAAPPPPVIPTPSPRRLIRLAAAGLVTGLAVLYFFNPVEHAFYPSCQFYKLTNLHCPGCGSLRALHQLTHGHVRSAFHSNPLLLASLPLFAWLVFCKLRPSQNHPANPRPVHFAVVWIILGVVIAFGVLRNFPGPMFSWMSP